MDTAAHPIPTCLLQQFQRQHLASIPYFNLVGIRFYESVVNGVSRSEADAITQLVTTQVFIPFIIDLKILI